MRPSKAIGILGASIGLAGAITFTTCIILAENGAIPFLSEKYRSYHGEFYVDDVLVYETTQKRGTEIIIPEDVKTDKEGDADGNYYTFIGWDTNSDSIPDITPSSMYYNFRADACYLKFKLPDIDLSNFDLEKLLQFLEDYNISLEDLLDFLNMDLEDLLEWLEDMGVELPVDFTVTADNSIVSPYFRVESYGDWNYKKKKWNEADYFDANSILGSSSINPLDFTASKIQNSLLLSSKYTCEITYEKVSEPYPTLVYERKNNSTNIKSDAYQTIEPVNNKYTATGFPLVYNQTMLKVIEDASFGNSSYTAAEQDYSNYCFNHYLNVPSEYEDLFSNITTSEEFTALHVNKYKKGSKNYDAINNIYAYILDFCSFQAEDIIDNYSYPSGTDPIKYFAENRKGSAKHIANFATLLYRYMGIPARYVDGYLAWDQINRKEISVNYSHKWGWVEVYLEGVGWIDIDCCSYYGEASQGNVGDSGDISTDVPTKGPGEGGPDSANGNKGDAFTFVSPYEGTVYFRSRSLDKYNLGSWTSDSKYTAPENEKYNPLSYSYYGGSDYFKTTTFNINYKENAIYGCAPEYSSISPNGTDDIYAGEVKAGKTIKYETRIMNFTEENINKLTAYYSKAGNSLSTSQSDYAFEIQGKYRDLSLNAGIDLGGYNSYEELIKLMVTEALLDSGYGTSLSSIESLSAYKKAMIVKNYLQSKYVYNINYDYGDDCIDPLIGFYTQREGICSTFATAATLMFRYIGFDARYVIGYVSSSVPNITCYVGSKSCHAWTEIYVPQAGWLSIDCTGFEAGNGTIDPTKPNGGDSSYGDGPSGDGLQESLQVVNINYMLLTQTIDYHGREVLPEDFDTSHLFKIVQKDSSQINQEDFDDNYIIEIESVYANIESLELFFPWNKDETNSKCYIKYKIYSKATGADVTSLFFNANKGTSLVADGVEYAISRVNVVFNNVEVTFKTPSVTIDESEVDFYMDEYMYDFEYELSTNIYGDSIEIDEDTIVLIKDTNYAYYTFDIKVYNMNGNDVTDFYNNVTTDWGIITYMDYAEDES